MLSIEQRAKEFIEKIELLDDDAYVLHGEDYSENYIGSGADLKSLVTVLRELVHAGKDLKATLHGSSFMFDAALAKAQELLESQKSEVEGSA